MDDLRFYAGGMGKYVYTSFYPTVKSFQYGILVTGQISNCIEVIR